MSIYNIADSQFSGQLFAVGIFDRSMLNKTKKAILFGAIGECYRNCTRVFIMSPQNSVLQHFLIVNVDFLWISHNDGDAFRHSNLIDFQIRVGTDDRSSGEIYPFAA